MNNVAQQLDQFQQFALTRLQSSRVELSIDELYDEWRRENPDPQDLERDARAIAASLRDFDQGNQGRPVEDFVREFKSTSRPE